MRNVKRPRNFRARCLLCPWASEGGTSPVFEGYEGLRHVRRAHPDAEGFVVAVEKLNLHLTRIRNLFVEFRDGTMGDWRR